MNILFFIGNGFDLNLGMKTSYSDFYKYYQSVNSPNEFVNELKNDIAKNFENWSDLELALGDYTKKLKATDEFDEVFEDIGDRLAEYLQQIENDFDYINDDEHKRKLFDYLSFPERTLLAADKNNFDTFKAKWDRHQWNIYIITFNYTKSLEKLLGFKGEGINLGSHNGVPIVLYKIEHIHGYVDDRMIMGVNDNSQIANSTFHDNQDVQEALVKNNCNQAHKHTIDFQCKNLVTNSNLICIFGSSIGDTDNMWWELIGEQLKGDCRLIIFDRGKDVSSLRGYKKARIERIKKDAFLKKTKLTAEQKEVASTNIFIGINTKMFDLS